MNVTQLHPDPVAHLRNQPGVTIEGKEVICGKHVVYVRVESENNYAGIRLGGPITVITRSWYCAYGGDEYGESFDNGTGGPAPTKAEIVAAARKWAETDVP